MKSLIKILLIALVALVGCKSSSKLTESTVSTSNERIEVNSSVSEKKDLNVQKDVQIELETVTDRKSVV